MKQTIGDESFRQLLGVGKAGRPWQIRVTNWLAGKLQAANSRPVRGFGPEDLSSPDHCWCKCSVPCCRAPSTGWFPRVGISKTRKTHSRPPPVQTRMFHIPRSPGTFSVSSTRNRLLLPPGHSSRMKISNFKRTTLKRKIIFQWEKPKQSKVMKLFMLVYGWLVDWSAKVWVTRSRIPSPEIQFQTVQFQ